VDMNPVFFFEPFPDWKAFQSLACFVDCKSFRSNLHQTRGERGKLYDPQW
jgi:hypothetical protein